MVTYGAPPPKKKGKGSGTRIGQGREEVSQGIPVRSVGRDDADSGPCPPRYSYRPNHNKYATGTDACMPLAADRTAGERVVSSMIPERSGQAR
jgi:hypothetical protein